jgi:hypothetical protein
MIGKPITGRSFGGCVRYIVDKPETKILFTQGVRMQNATTLTNDFNLQRKMRPELGKAVGHLVLSWSKEDLPKLTDSVMLKHAKEYMHKMGIRDTQYVVVRHHDRLNSHLHVVYNRVDNKGATITDKNNYARNIRACKELTLKYSYHWAKGKEQVNRQALNGSEKIRYELYDAIKAAMKTSANWKELESKLAVHDINIAYKFKSGTKEVQGISFEKGGLKMKGSAIDRSLSFSRMAAQLNRNQQVQDYHAAREAHQPSLAQQLREAVRQGIHAEHQHSPNASGVVENLLNILLSPEFVPSAPDPVGDAEIARRKRKKHQAEQSQGVTR